MGGLPPFTLRVLEWLEGEMQSLFRSLLFTVFRTITAIPEPIRSLVLRLLPPEFRGPVAPRPTPEATISNIRFMLTPEQAELLSSTIREFFYLPEIRFTARYLFRYIPISPEALEMLSVLRNAFVEVRAVIFDPETGTIYRTSFRFSYGQSVTRELLMRRLLNRLAKEFEWVGYEMWKSILKRAFVFFDTYLVGRFPLEG